MGPRSESDQASDVDHDADLVDEFAGRDVVDLPAAIADEILAGDAAEKVHLPVRHAHDREQPSPHSVVLMLVLVRPIDQPRGDMEVETEWLEHRSVEALGAGPETGR